VFENGRWQASLRWFSAWWGAATKSTQSAYRLAQREFAGCVTLRTSPLEAAKTRRMKHHLRLRFWRAPLRSEPRRERSLLSTRPQLWKRIPSYRANPVQSNRSRLL